MSAKYAEMTINKQLQVFAHFLVQPCLCRVIGCRVKMTQIIQFKSHLTTQNPQNFKYFHWKKVYKKENIFYNTQVVGQVSGGVAM